jgi:hypothetical protein
LIGALAAHTRWHTVDVDAFGEPTQQVATITFKRNVWDGAGVPDQRLARR